MAIGENWDDWLARLKPSDQELAEQLRRRFSELEATEPDAWARSELSENFAQTARFIFLKRVWMAILAWDRPGELEDMYHTRKLLDDGADRETLATAMRAAAFDIVVSIIGTLDQERDWDAPDNAPGWRFMETDAEGELTGRPVAGLHESLLKLDPSGQDGEALWG